jgi:hypothetical protein
MAQLKWNKLNIIDLAVATVVLLLLGIGAMYYTKVPVSDSTNLQVEVEVSDPIQVEVVYEQATKDKTVFLNSNRDEVSVVEINRAGELLTITLVGPGHIDSNGDAVFIGQRIFIGQKAEIRASYFAKAKVTKIENAE